MNYEILRPQFYSKFSFSFPFTRPSAGWIICIMLKLNEHKYYTVNIVYTITDQWNLNCVTSLLTINKMEHQFILSMSAKGNLLALNWKDATWANFEVLEIFSYLAGVVLATWSKIQRSSLLHRNRIIFIFFFNYFSCVYRFESERDERIRITIKKVVTSNRQCLSRVDPDTKRSYCFGDQRAKLQVCFHFSVILLEFY